MFAIRNVDALRPLLDEMAHSTETAAATSESAAGQSAEDPPVSGPAPEILPSLPTQDAVNTALKALRDRQVGSAKHESTVAGLPASSGAGGRSPFAVLADLFAARGLNPQPLPPGDPKRVVAFPGDPIAPRALNPQPLPPGDPKHALVFIPTDPIAARGLNPQPLPPGDPKHALVFIPTDPVAARGLNPQPLPPGDPKHALVFISSYPTDPIAARGLNPQPLPPGESPQNVDKSSLASRIG